MTKGDKVEALVNWYLRFNGYFTVPNFTVHPDRKKGAEAEADILAVRFPFSREHPGRYNFQRDAALLVPNATDFLIAEAKSGLCSVNDAWTDPQRENIEYVLRWFGFIKDDDGIEQVADRIYKEGAWSDDQGLSIRLACFGAQKSDDLNRQMPKLVQIELLHVIDYVRERLTTGCAQLHRERWDPYIQEFAQRSESGQNPDELNAWTLT